MQKSINRENSEYILKEGVKFLICGKKSIGRKIRRLIGIVLDEGNPGFLSVSFANNGEGYTPGQLRELGAYMRRVINGAIDCNEGAFNTSVRLTGFTETADGVVRADFSISHDINTASVKELVSVLEAVVALCESIREITQDKHAPFVEHVPYRYRGLPCSITNNDRLWCVSGKDVRGGGGILEWAYDETDAKSLLKMMHELDPFRFKSIRAEKYQN